MIYTDIGSAYIATVAKRAKRPPNPNDPVAVFLKGRRKKLRLKQTEIAARIGVPQARVAEWERGAHKPSFMRLSDVADAYEVPVEELMALARGRPKGGQRPASNQ